MQANFERRPTKPLRSCWSLSHPLMPVCKKWSGSWAWNFVRTIPRQWSPSRKPEPSAPMLPSMLKPSALQLSRRPRPPAPTPSRKPKPFAPQPSGMQRPGEPPRLTHSTGNMPRPSNTWRNKSSKRKVRVRLTFSLPVKLTYKPTLQNSEVHW